MDDETKAAITEALAAGLAALKTDIEGFVTQSVAAAESKAELRFKTIETSGGGKPDPTKAGTGESALQTQLEDMQRQLEQRDQETLRHGVSNQLIKAATALGCVAPGVLGELLLNRIDPTTVVAHSGGVFTVGVKPLDTIVKEFLGSDEGATFRAVKDASAPPPSPKDQPSGTGGTGDGNNKAELDKAWGAFAGTYQ